MTASTKRPHPSHERPAPRTYRDIQSIRDASDNVIPPESEWPQLPEGNPWKFDPVGKEEPIDGTLCADVLGQALGGSSPPKKDEP